MFTSNTETGIESNEDTVVMKIVVDCANKTANKNFTSYTRNHHAVS